MCTDINNNYLVTGDATGKIMVWYIAGHCLISPEINKDSSTSTSNSCVLQPPLLYSWQAHARTFVSLEFIQRYFHLPHKGKEPISCANLGCKNIDVTIQVRPYFKK